LSFKSIKVYGV